MMEDMDMELTQTNIRILTELLHETERQMHAAFRNKDVIKYRARANTLREVLGISGRNTQAREQ